jgi:hypothetical protein
MRFIMFFLVRGMNRCDRLHISEHTVSLVDSINEFWLPFKDAEEYFRDAEETSRLYLKLREPCKSLGVAVSLSRPCKILFMLPSCTFSLKEFSHLNLSNKAAEDEKTDTALESVL